MKKIKFLSAFLLFGLTTFAQNEPKETYASLSLKTDVLNATFGSKPTGYNSALDLCANVNMVSKNFELSAGYEHFQVIGFSRCSLDFGWHSQRYIPERFIPFANKDFDFTAVPSVGFSMINRFNMENTALQTDRSSHLAVQANMSFRTKLTDKILLDWTIQGLTRPDSKAHYPTDNPKFFVVSNFIGIHYIITDY